MIARAVFLCSSRRCGLSAQKEEKDDPLEPLFIHGVVCGLVCWVKSQVCGLRCPGQKYQ